jgi:uncharacterized Ntn-hydrolase superfamily protein
VTYSVVARDPDTGAFGVAVQSHYFATGAVVPWVEAGVGAVATQAMAEVSYGPLGLERMRAGQSASDALAALVAADPGRDTRQVAMVDNAGMAVAHTGRNCIAHAGARGGEGWSVQANMMRNTTVPDSMALAYLAAPGDFVERLLVTLDAAEAAGGDVRGQQSAALVVSSTAADASVSAGSVVRLHVEDHPQPLVELRRLVAIHRGYEEMNAAFERMEAGDFDSVVPALERALAFAPDNDEMTFRLGAVLTISSDPRGRELLDGLFAKNPGWRELIPRLVAVGSIPDLPGVVALLTGE